MSPNLVLKRQFRRPDQCAAPLVLCYLLFPISNLVAELLGRELVRNWIDLAWVMIGAAALTRRSTVQSSRRPGPPLLPLFALAAALSVWIVFGVLTGRAPAVTGAMEIKPAFYLLVALLLVRAYGMPTPETFCRMGSALSALLIAELMLRSAASGKLERPLGSGEVNYDAALLCVSLVFALGRRDMARRFGPLIFLGLLATFSRTSLLAACAVLLFASTVPLTLRALMVGVAVGTAVLSFVIRDLEIGALESMDRYWMWFVGIQYLSDNLAGTALVSAPGSGVEVDVPRFLLELWTEQQEKLDLDGIFPFHFHAMWIRLSMAWGWLPVALLLLATLRALVLRERRPAQARALAGACLVLGLTMGLVYLGNVGVPLLLAAFQLFASQPRVRRHFSRTAGKTAGSPPLPA